MNLKQAHYIKTISECGSITAAAKKLYVSQPSLSQMLRHVEEELGVEIFDRSIAPFQLTYAGEKYLHAAQIMLSAQEQLESEIREIRHEYSGRLRLGISVSRGMQVLPLVIPKFTAQYPNVKLELVESGSDTLDAMLKAGKIDLALAATEATNPEVTYELIERETIGVLAGKDTRIARCLPNGTPITIEDVKDESFVCLCKGHSARIVQDKFFRKIGCTPNIFIETNSLEIGKRITLETNACMILPNIYIDDFVAHKQGSFFPLTGEEHNRHFYACYRRDAFIPQYIYRFIQVVIEALNYRPETRLPD